VNIPARNFSTTFPITSIASSFGKFFSSPFGFVSRFRNWGGAFTAALAALAESRLPAAVTASAVAAVSAATARCAVRLRLGFIDVQRSAVEVSTVESANGGVSFGIDTHFDEGEASGLSGIAIRHYVDALNGPIGIKHGAEGIFGGSEAEVAYKNIFHLF